MLDLVAGIQIARRVTEERFAYDAEGGRSTRRRSGRSPIRAIVSLRRSLHLGRDQRPESAVGRVDAC
jgi:hypothetical protein